MDNFKEIVLKQINWQRTHSTLKNLKFDIKLLEGQKNAKHQKLTLSIEIFSQSQSLRFYKKFKTSDLPSEAITIFYDVQNLYQYIDQYYSDSDRIKFDLQQNSLVVVNIVIMKNKQIKQQISLNLLKEKYIYQKLNRINSSKEEQCLDSSRISQVSSKQIIEQSKIIIQSLIKEKNADLETKVSNLSEYITNFIGQIRILKTSNQTLSNALNSCNLNVMKLQKQNSLLNQRVSVLQKSTSQWSNKMKLSQKDGINQNKVNEFQKHISDHKWHIDQINYNFQNIKEQHRQMQKKCSVIQNHFQKQPKLDNVFPMVNQLQKDVFVLTSQYVQLKENSSKLGEKIHLNIDFDSNKYLNNFRIVENIIEKIGGDEQRHQLLGKQNLNLSFLKKKSYFEIKIITTVNAGVVVGVVSDVRKNERYSYDKKECVCYDGRGFIFEQGQKIKMACKFDNGQTIRLVVDPLQFTIHWYVGYTEIGSTYIPESMRTVKIVPYLQLYELNDKIAING